MLVRIPQASLTTALKNSCYSSAHVKYSNLLQKCGFSSQGSPENLQKISQSITGFPPLSEPILNLPKPIYSTAKEEDQTTQISVLSNGLRVASENRFGKFCTVGVLIDSGPRFEVAYPSGISHFLEKLAFNSTKNYESRDEIMLTLEKHGGICDCQASRDTFIYAASAESQGLDTVTKILGDIVLRPTITEDELNFARQTVQFELETLHTRPEQEPLLIDMIHAAAYSDNTLGLPKLCPSENIGKINRNILFTYLKNYYTPKRMVVAGVGIEHNDLVNAVKKYFVNEKPIWEQDSSLALDKINTVDNSIAQYTGGLVVEDCNVPVYAGPSGLPELSHVVIGLEGCSHQDPDFISMCVLNMMMGGGGSFSAGGPEMVQVIVKELVAMAGDMTDNELARAKKQLQSMLLMNLEQRPVVFEDIGRQVLATGTRKRPEYFIQEIDKISKDDIHRVARRLLKSPPSVAARGEIKNTLSLSEIQAGLLDTHGQMSGIMNRLSIFR
ncbi:Similar to PMPCA: Mitochondrial-processing peptidase subunit alpha (Pongo abelii) [Cotesia congregata]|uniref:Mitochondrial-processing peptidase subunit alpha n=1 Tax=Cotesia congregata TaxID=51543 RepID=A0A8J2HH39_COTCN|nr:Similar to PMPCA: Mitochondrial-processing peptidase subunit alpha (Pongo abelii) [Cotesia congregata]